MHAPARTWRVGSGAVPVALALALAACGRDSETSASNADGSAGNDGATTDGAGGATPPDAPADGCHPPVGATALCLTFSPEGIQPELEQGLDQRGFFRVEVFDTATPSARAVPIYERTVPVDLEAGAEVSLSDLPAPTIVLADPPPAVYVRALFFDNGRLTLADGSFGINWGTWLGGFDLSGGIGVSSALIAVPVTPGEVTVHDVPLIARRRLMVTVTTSVTPLGDGEGALSVTASRVAALPPYAPAQGYGIDPCVDITQGPQTVEVQLVGSGMFYVTAYFDDLGIETTGALPPGTLLSLRDVNLAAGEATFDQITVGQDQYSAAMSVDLGYVVELPGDPGVLGPNSCADLGLPGAP